MTAINEIPAKVDNVPFTCNWLTCCKNELTGACSCKKDILKISANFSNCDGVCFQKRIISTTGECALKKNSATNFFVYYDISQFKNLKLSRPWKQLPIHWSGEIFPFHLIFPNEGCSCTAQLHHVKKWSVKFVQEVVKYVWKIHNIFHWSDQKHLFLTNFWGGAGYISSWYFQIRKKSTQRLV